MYAPLYRCIWYTNLHVVMSGSLCMHIYFSYIPMCLYYTCVIFKWELSVLGMESYDYATILILNVGGGLSIAPNLVFITFNLLDKLFVWAWQVDRISLLQDFLVSVAVMSSQIGLCTSLLHNCHGHIFLFVSQTCVWSRGQIGWEVHRCLAPATNTVFYVFWTFCGPVGGPFLLPLFML